MRLHRFGCQIAGGGFVYAEDFEVCGSGSGLIDDGRDPADDQVEVAGCLDGDDGWMFSTF